MKKLTIASVVGLAAGAGLGALLGAGKYPALEAALAWFVQAWTGTFIVIVLPLVVGLVFAAVAGGSGQVSSRRLGLFVPAVFVGLLVFVALATVVVSEVAFRLPWLQSLSLPMLSAAPSPPATEPVAGGWLTTSPRQLVSAAAGGDVLALMVLTFLAALFARRVAPEARELLVTFGKAVAEVMMIGARALLMLAPPVMFAVAFAAGQGSGSNVGTVLLAFVTVKSLICLVIVLSLYPVATLLGGVSFTRFAQAVFPAQVVALTSRSSLATLPALIEGAQNRLGLAPTVSEVVLPIAGATLKLSRAFSSPIKLLFLAHVLGLSLTPSQMIVFTATILLLSPATVGMPQVVSTTKTLPAYIAAGVPAEHVLLLGLTKGLTDALVTLLNATGYMSATVLVDRLAGREHVSVGVPERTHSVPAPAATTVESPPL